jgi:hypothetical protein
VTSLVRNWTARIRRAIQKAMFDQKKEPGVLPSKDGIGVDNNLSIFIFVADFESIGKSSP